MPRLWIGLVAACGVVAGTVFACQAGKAAEPVSGSAARGRADASRPPALQSFFDQQAAAAGSRQLAARGTPAEKPAQEPLTVLKSGPDHVRVVYRLKNCPVTDVNRVLQELFRLEGGLHKSATSSKGAAGSGVAIVPDPVTNSLFISGAPGAVEEVQGLLDKVDQPPQMLLVEVEIGVAPVGEAKPAASPQPKEKSRAAANEPFRLPQRPEKMETMARARLMTLDNQPGFVHTGSRVPRVTGTTVSATGGETWSTTLSNVGPLVGVTARIDPHGAVTMQIDVELSQVGPESEGIPISVAAGKVLRSPRIDATTIQTTVRIPNGQTLVLGSIAGQGKSDKEADKELVIIVTPHIIGADPAPQPGAATTEKH